MTQNLPFPQITRTAGMAGQLRLKKKINLKKNLFDFFPYSFS